MNSASTATNDTSAPCTSLLYVSTLAPFRHLGVVAEIARQSRANNAAAGISGLLIFDGASFAQWLEGPAEAMALLLQRLQSDTRHIDVEVLYLAPMAGPPRFQNWSLGYMKVDDERASIRGLRGHRGADALAAYRALLPAFDASAGDAIPANVALRRLTTDLRRLNDRARESIHESRRLLASLRSDAGGSAQADAARTSPQRDLSPKA